MPTYRGIEVWIEDSEYRKLNHQEVTINLVDDRTVTVKTEMSRDEFYTIHCLSPISIFCDVFVATGSSRRRAARFYLDKSLAISKKVSGSSADHTEGWFRDHGLRTPKRQLKNSGEYNPIPNLTLTRGARRLCNLVGGGLGSVEVEIRRIGEIIKGEPREEYEVDGDEEVATEFCMVDDFDQPPWLVFHFDITVKESLAVPASTVNHIKRRRVSDRTLKNKNQSQASRGSKRRTPSAEGPSNETSREAGYECLHNSKKRPREQDGRDKSASVCKNPINANSELLQQEYQKEEVEERRLLRKLQPLRNYKWVGTTANEEDEKYEAT
ncbi:hypothetical protein J3R83DRAFT_3615 [Lanmaoa asiatica]|nr:hypothetical protein J3R83DRAFT_3615 [Lanmaoa asiatica]